MSSSHQQTLQKFVNDVKGNTSEWAKPENMHKITRFFNELQETEKINLLSSLVAMLKGANEPKTTKVFQNALKLTGLKDSFQALWDQYDTYVPDQFEPSSGMAEMFEVVSSLHHRLSVLERKQ